MVAPRVDPTLPHEFHPREHGAKTACRICGAPKLDPIHQIKRTPRWPNRGQALVEFALVTPLLLLLLLGIVWTSYLELGRLRLAHAAAEGASAGAAIPGDSCGVAIESARKVYGRGLIGSVCEVKGQVLSLTLTDTLEFATPWGTEWGLTATERAIVR